MVLENLDGVERPNLILGLILPEDADFVHALRTDPTHNQYCPPSAPREQFGLFA
jgi:hypothetical protein